MTGLLDRRLIFVTGKGGVGKSTVAAALGLRAARAGRRTIVAELARQDGVRRTFAQPGGTFEEVELAEDLYTISVDPESAMEEYLRVKTGALGQALGSSRLFQAFAMATPGMRELLSVGKVYELAQFTRHTGGADPYDLVIVDSPAAGHGIGILRTPRTFAEIARVGPIAGTAQRIAATVSDPGFTAIVAVCVAEEMPVNETLWLRDQLHADGLELGAVFVNALLPARFSDAEARRLRAAHRRALGAGGDRSGSGAADGDGALGAALSEHARARAQREELARLRAGLGRSVPSVELPFLFAESLAEPELRALADVLEDVR
ncbi:MAG TPA: ArsA-related P-loop ATPase [Solirubrobacteraceae bacterium]|nr:ArsA-related P-loop ATPase [Solirubrobacteraceae bacterium]